MKTDELMAALAARYCRPAWAFLPEVRNGTGYQREPRTADAMAMSLWPSRGLELHGFEVKASRADWLGELKNPAKAEEIAAFCDRWWLVVGDKEIVKPAELPPTWGLMIPRGTGLIAVTEAPKLDATPLDRLFVASLLRKVTETWTRGPLRAGVGRSDHGLVLRERWSRRARRDRAGAGTYSPPDRRAQGVGGAHRARVRSGAGCLGGKTRRRAPAEAGWLTRGGRGESTMTREAAR